ncbi:MAG TPA: hypothetical protein VJG13_08270 [Thermoanaerobaculia bacterium]|nr:hypothetical protein [Thermoanaerobaculia bacterium]
MKTYRGQQLVDPGIYLNLRELAFKSMDEDGRLPGTEEAVWRRVPALAMLVAAPLVSIVYFIFLPLVGFLMLAGVVGLKLFELGRRLAAGALPVLRPAWQPALAFLSRGKPAREAPVEEALEAKRKDRWAEEARREAEAPEDEAPEDEAPE